MKPPKRSSDAAEPAEAPARPSPETLVETVRLVAERDYFGMVWCSPKLIAEEKFGRVVEFVPLGLDVTLGILPLFGLGEQIAALRRKPQATLDIPNVSIIAADGPTPRLDLHVFWAGRRRQYVVLVGRVMSASDLEIELTRQIRARMIVEATLLEKSREIERANAELLRVNRDLNEFAHVISHDLKAPLRAMRYCADDIEAALDDTGPSDPRGHLEELRCQSRRMSHMLTDLLAYSRIGRKEEAIEPVDTRALVDAVVRSIPRPPGIRVEIVGVWPEVSTLSAPLDLVLRNLLENAVKHHDRTQGLVRLAATPAGGLLEIEVADDGPGIDPRHHQLIFQPFRRLGEGGDLEGSGIGLSLVRKTVEVAGGTLEVRSDPATARGTTLKFTWPVTIEAKS